MRLIFVTLAVMGVLSVLAFQFYVDGIKNLSLFTLGIVVMLFGLVAHLYRHAMQQIK